MNYQYHPFHMVSPSLYPLAFGLGTCANAITAIEFTVGAWDDYLVFDYSKHYLGIAPDWVLLMLSVFFYAYISYEWINAECYEGAWYGCHTWYAQTMYRIGWVFFVLTEIMIFFSFFWAFGYYALSPAVELGMEWVPSSIVLINPFHLPLMNTAILLSSGVTATLSHYYFLSNVYKKAGTWMTVTLVLGVYFLFLQLWEYSQVSFTMNDSVFGSIFFVTTGMHGSHVSGGVSVLFIARWRMTHPGWSEWINWSQMKTDLDNLFGVDYALNELISYFKFPSQFTYYSHLNLELAIWYWHFVDIVWLLLYSIMYCWIYYK